MLIERIFPSHLFQQSIDLHLQRHRRDPDLPVLQHLGMQLAQLPDDPTIRYDLPRSTIEK